MKKQVEPTQQGPIKKYVLYFDISQTIILTDKLDGQNSKEQALMEILAQYAWGKLDENTKQWKLIHNVFSKNPPQQDLISYKYYVENILYPEKTPQNESNEELRQQYNRELSSIRIEEYLDFVRQGKAGMKLKPDLDKIQKHLTLPKSVFEDIKLMQQQPKLDDDAQLEFQIQDQHQNIDNISDIFADGKYHILPIFYKTLMQLKKNKKEFSIVFRSFGSDLKNVIREFNKFCQGDHPCFNGKNNTPLIRFDGTKGTKNYVINEQQTGLYYRYSDEVDQTKCVFGTLNRKDKNNLLEDAYSNEIDEDIVSIQSGAGNIYLYQMELLKQSCALAFNDDIQFWNENNQKEKYSKLMMIDQYDYSTLHIFFDDQIQDNEKNIVDVRDTLTGKQLSNKRTFNKYLVKVEIIDMIKDPEFLLKVIDQCEKRRLEEIERFEKGLPAEEIQEEQKKSEWEQLQELSDPEYLRRTVMPLLHPALQIVDIERPNDPISFIAFYMLKNKDKVQLPQPQNNQNQQENQDLANQ